MQPESAITPISAAEVESHLEYARRVLTAANEAERGEVLADELLAFGHRALLVWHELSMMAPDEQKSFYRDVLDEATLMYTGWIKGTSLTRRPDEAERRALAGLLMLEQRPDLQHLHHFAAQAILCLPKEHTRRDTDLARKCVIEELAWLRKQGEATPWVSLAGALGVAYRERCGTEEEMLSWEAWAAEAAPHLEALDALRMWNAVAGYYTHLADTDEANEGKWMADAMRIHALTDALPMTPRMRAESYLTAARLYTQDDDQRAMAALFKQALDTGALAPHVERMIANKEARVRMRYGELQRVIEILGPRVEGYEEDYITTTTSDEDQTAAGEECDEAAALLAFALAKLGRWTEAVETIERGKCLRQRYVVALRETPEAVKLLEIEGELYALSRGLAPQKTTEAVEQMRDWFARGLSPGAQLREEYRKLLPKLEGQLARAVSVVEIASGLREGEAALSLGLWWPGLIAALVVKGSDKPAWTQLREDVTQAAVIGLLAGKEGQDEGFLLALERGVLEADPRPALERLLAHLDEVIGAPVAAVLQEYGLKRLVVLPHNFLRLAPLWALESWREFDVRMAPGAFALLKKQKPVVRGQALIAANPTLDLPMAATEAAVVAERLSVAGLKTRVLTGAGATEGALAAALQQSNLLHFAGHGIASLTNGSMSALLASPVWNETPLAGARELLALESKAAEMPQLIVDREEGSPRRKIFYEYAKSGTLYAEVEGDTVLLVGELWRAGDILVQGTLKDCGLAFLCACSSGLGAIESLQEASGLPAALEIAGVGSVISTGWPVADEITVLFADEFYARALPPDGGVTDVVAAVRGAAGHGSGRGHATGGGAGFQSGRQGRHVSIEGVREAAVEGR
jgi:CHAT domain-containing protein